MIEKLEPLLGQLRKCGAEDTAYGEYDPKTSGTLHNHCGCVAYAVQQVMGGDIMQGKICGVSHQWNRVDDIEFDLCSEQFGKTGITFFPQSKGRKAPQRKNTNPRFLKFWNRFKENNNNENSKIT